MNSADEDSLRLSVESCCIDGQQLSAKPFLIYGRWGRVSRWTGSDLGNDLLNDITQAGIDTTFGANTAVLGQQQMKLKLLNVGREAVRVNAVITRTTVGHTVTFQANQSILEPGQQTELVATISCLTDSWALLTGVSFLFERLSELETLAAAGDP